MPKKGSKGSVHRAIKITPLGEAFLEIERLKAIESLLKEGVEGFSRVLVATSDQERVYEWVARCRAALNLDRALKTEEPNG